MSKNKQLEKVRQDYIRYSNCWEDADILLKGLNCLQGKKIISIGSAGDNSFSLLCTDAEMVTAVDINPVQLKLIELKKTAISVFTHAEYLDFYGFTGNYDKIPELFEKLLPELTPEVRYFWINRKEEIFSGLVHAGKFEKYFHIFSKKILSLIHKKKCIQELFREKSGSEQKKYFVEHWNNFRWRFLFKFFFSKFVMGRLGRSKEFMNQVTIDVGEFIYNRASKHLSSTACQENYFLEYIMKHKFNENLPHYVRKENFEKIKKNISKLHVFNGFVEDAFKEYGKFDYFNLSDIFEYMNPEIFKNVAANLSENANPEARFAYWNLMVPRYLSDILPHMYKFSKDLSENLTNEDKGFFYKSFIVDEI